MSLQIQLTSKKNYIMFAEDSFDSDGLATEQKLGFLKIDPDKNPDDVLEKAKQRSWQLIDKDENTGLYKVSPINVAETADVEQE